MTIYGKSVLPGHTVDLSQSGASFTVPFELDQGQQCLIDLELEACGETAVFHIPAEVRYCVQMGRSRWRAGMRFGETDPATSALIEAILKTRRNSSSPPPLRCPIPERHAAHPQNCE